MEEKHVGVEFQAVILAGGSGNRLHPLSSSDPKPLMPVGNRPLLAFQLELLERSGFEHVIVVTSTPISRQVAAYVNEYHEFGAAGAAGSAPRREDGGDGGDGAAGGDGADGADGAAGAGADGAAGDAAAPRRRGRGSKLRIEVVTVDADLGTADALRHISDRLHTDFFVVSGDLITDVFIHYLADIHRSKDATLTALLQAPPAPDSKKAAEDAKKKDDGAGDIGRQFIGLAGEEGPTKRIALFKPLADVEDDALVVGKLLLRRHPHLTVHSSHKDAHLYVFSRWVLDVLVDKEHMSSIQGELVPYLVSLQYAEVPEVYAAASRGSSKQGKALAMAHGPGVPDAGDLVRCYAHVAPPSAYCIRVNTVPNYVQANHDVASEVPPDKWTPVASAADVSPAVGANSVVGPHVSLGAGSTVKRSVVGSHCKIGKGVKISSCIIHDNVTIEDKCVLQNVVVCREATVEARSTLKDSQVGAKFVVPAKSEIKNEVLFVARD